MRTATAIDLHDWAEELAKTGGIGRAIEALRNAAREVRVADAFSVEACTRSYGIVPEWSTKVVRVLTESDIFTLGRLETSWTMRELMSLGLTNVDVNQIATMVKERYGLDLKP